MGKKYLAMAFALARSYKFHNGSKASFAIASGKDFNMPHDLAWVQKIIVMPQYAGQGLEFKLHLVDIAPAKYSIFIDADSLIYGDIGFVFDKFDKSKPSVIGLKLTEGEWVDENISSVCKEFELPYLIRFCGALYYVVKNENSREIFNYALSLHCSTRKFQRNERTMYDEPIMAVALSKYHAEPVIDDGNIWGDLAQFKYHDTLNVFNGPSTLHNDKNNGNYKFWLPEGDYRPLIMHVGSGNYNKTPWLFDALRLKLHYKFGLNTKLANTLVEYGVKPFYYSARKILRARSN